MKWNGNTYEVTQACGHVIAITTKDEAVADEMMKVVCGKCKAILLFNDQKNLQPLVGSPAQVRWANQIRKSRIEELDGVFEANIKKGRQISEKHQYAYDSIKNEVDASFFIDSRKKSTQEFFMDYMKQMEKEPNIKTDEHIAAEEVIIKPQTQTELIPAEINVQMDTVVVFFKKHTAVNELLKRLEYKWDKSNKCWHKDCGNGKSLDRAAETGARLLQIGVSVVIHNKQAREKLLSMNFDVENFNKIRYKDDKFIIKCSEESLGKQLIGFLGATKLSDDVYSVRSVYARDLKDFATEHNFEYTNEAAVFMESLPVRTEIIMENTALSDLLDE